MFSFDATVTEMTALYWKKFVVVNLSPGAEHCRTLFHCGLGQSLLCTVSLLLLLVVD